MYILRFPSCCWLALAKLIRSIPFCVWYHGFPLSPSFSLSITFSHNSLSSCAPCAKSSSLASPLSFSSFQLFFLRPQLLSSARVIGSYPSYLSFSFSLLPSRHLSCLTLPPSTSPLPRPWLRPPLPSSSTSPILSIPLSPFPRPSPRPPHRSSSTSLPIPLSPFPIRVAGALSSAHCLLPTKTHPGRVGAVWRWTPRFVPRSGRLIYHSDGAGNVHGTGEAELEWGRN